MVKPTRAHRDNQSRPREVETETICREATIQPGAIRAADDVAGEGGDDDRTREVLFSTDTRVERRVWGETIIEVLDHSSESVRMDFIEGGTAPLLMDHDTRDQIGVVESAELEGGNARAIVRFSQSERASSILADVDAGIRRNVSVGYDIYKAVREETNEEGPDVIRVTDWRPLEVSVVSIPADMSAGFGRKHRTLIEEPQDMRLTRDGADPQETGPTNTPAPANVRSGGQDEQETQRIREAATAEARRAEIDRIREITALGERHNCGDLAQQHIREGTTLEAFRGLLLDQIGDSRPLYDPPSQVGASQAEMREYSILRVARALLARQEGRNPRDVAPFEFEVSDHVGERLGRDPQGCFIPFEWSRQSVPDFDPSTRGLDALRTVFPDAFRALNIGTPAEGGNLVGTDHLGASFIELLRNRMVIRQLGARIMTGLVGDIAIPKQTGAGTAYWVAEAGDVTKSQQTFGQVTMAPKSVGAITEYTRKLMLQSDPSVDAIVRADLAAILARAIDYAAINGSGTNNEPLGILNTAGIGLVVMGDPDGGPISWAKTVEFETLVSTANADMGALWYLANSKVRGHAKVTPKEAGQPIYIWDTTMAGLNADTMNGYRSAVSNQVPGDGTKGTGTNLSSLIFGNFNDLLMGEWGALDFLVDRVSGGKFENANVGLRLMQDVDVAVRHPESFSAAKDINTG